MAKLGSYFGLCPLVDQEKLLGISEASEEGHIIVTLSPNIVLKYRVSDQKQVQSWRSKDKLSSPVIFNHDDNKYVGVFNFINLKVWSDDDKQLDKLKKYKFNDLIYRLVNVKDQTFIVFKNGNIFVLNKCMENRKGLSLAKIFKHEDEQIKDVLSTVKEDKVYFGIITNYEDDAHMYLSTISSEDHQQQVRQKINLNRKELTLSGCVLTQMYDKSVYFLSLWSNNKLYSLQVDNCQKNAEPWGEIYAKIRSVTSDQFVAMAPINNDNIAIYGPDPNQEGAKLIIYNTQFKVLQSIQSFKLFSKARKLWRIENFLFMCTGQNLAAVPFYINTEQLSAMVGSHKVDLKDNDVQQNFSMMNWKSEMDVEVDYKTPRKIKGKVDELLLQGLSEVAICDYLIPLYIENSEDNCLSECLDYFKDISEKSIINLLVYLLQKNLTVDSNFTSLNYKMIDKILSFSISNALLIPRLKKEFDVPIALYLIQYICYLLSSDGHNLPNLDVVESEYKLIEWGSMLLDANYQKLLLTSDVNVIETLQRFKDIVKEHLDCMTDIRSVAPLCENIVKKRVVNSVNHCNFKYCIKEVKF